jgi:hypothetical protein
MNYYIYMYMKFPSCRASLAFLDLSPGLYRALGSIRRGGSCSAGVGAVGGGWQCEGGGGGACPPSSRQPGGGGLALGGVVVRHAAGLHGWGGIDGWDGWG